MSFGWDGKAFGSSIVNGECTGSDPDMKMIMSSPKPGRTMMVSCVLQAVLYNLHPGDTSVSILIGSNCMSPNGLCFTFYGEKIIIFSDIILTMTPSLMIVHMSNQPHLLHL